MLLVEIKLKAYPNINKTLFKTKMEESKLDHYQ